MQIDPQEVQREVELAFCLEALIPKEGCTSRYEDVRGKKLEYFIFSAINSGKHFFDLAQRINLAQRIKEINAQPKVVYDLGYLAMTDSKRNRSGKIVNYGLIETMFPVVAAKCIFGNDAYSTLTAVPTFMQNTSKEDVRYVAEMRKLIYSQSNKTFKRDFVINYQGENVLEHYLHHQKVGPDVSKRFVKEFTTGMPLTKIIYESLCDKKKSLQEKINNGFNTARKESQLPYGAIADFTAVALYLLISENPGRNIFE